MWQRYYRYILTKLAFLKLFGSLGGQSLKLAVRETTWKTADSLEG
jgi:hypothetical protein